MAAKLVLEPIFKADFLDVSYGYRPKRSASEAVQAINSGIARGKGAIYDADLKGFFDSIPHDKLMAWVVMRVSDRSVLKLVRQWLCAPIPELIKTLNRQLTGWGIYFSKGHSRRALRQMNWFVFNRVVKHLKRRSQRPYRPPEGVSWYSHVHDKLGLVQL